MEILKRLIIAVVVFVGTILGIAYLDGKEQIEASMFASLFVEGGEACWGNKGLKSFSYKRVYVCNDGSTMKMQGTLEKVGE